MTAARRKKILDKTERLRLKEIYAEMTDQEIMAILIEDESAYQQEPFPEHEILLAEARKRMLEKQIKEVKEKNEALEAEMEQDIKLTLVYSGSLTEALMAKDILESNGINSLIKDENIATLAPHYVSPSVNNLGKVMVKTEQAAEAKSLLGQYLNT